ncbi:MAG: hypothetical protein R2777_09010 [Chitinophagales bacterium]
MMLALCCAASLLAQNQQKLKFFQPADSLNKARIIGLSTGLTLAYAGTMTGLNYMVQRCPTR